MDNTAGGVNYSYPVMSYPSTGSSTGSGSSQSSSQQSTQVLPQEAGYYQQLLGLNEANYNQMLGAYNQGQARISEQMPSINAGYNQLQNSIAPYAQTISAPMTQGIAMSQQQAMANNTQQAANSGLGNTSVLGNLQNQAAQQAQYGYAQEAGQLASQILPQYVGTGQAGLAAQMQGLGYSTQLTQGALSNLEQPYSNTFGNITGSFGQSQSSSVNNQQSQQQGGNNNGSGGGYGGSGGGLPAGVPGGPAGGGSGGGYGGAGAGGGVPNSSLVGGGGSYGSAGGAPGAPGSSLTGGGGQATYGPVTTVNGPNGPISVQQPNGPGTPVNEPGLGSPNPSPNSLPPDESGQMQGDQNGNPYGNVSPVATNGAAMDSTSTNYDLQQQLQGMQQQGQLTSDALLQQFGASGFGPGVTAAGWQPGLGAIKDAKGNITSWSPWGIGGQSGPAAG